MKLIFLYNSLGRTEKKKIKEEETGKTWEKEGLRTSEQEMEEVGENIADEVGVAKTKERNWQRATVEEERDVEQMGFVNASVV